MDEYNKFPSNFISSQFIKFISKDEITSIVESLGHTLSQKYQANELVLIGELKGSMTFLSELARQIKNVHLYVDFVKVSSRGRGKESEGTILIEKDISTNIAHKHVVIVEDVIDTGRAPHFLKQRLALAHPKSIEVITLFDKAYKRSVPLKADYIGKQIESQFIVGNGLDLENYGRNLEDVYYLQYPN